MKLKNKKHLTSLAFLALLLDDLSIPPSNKNQILEVANLVDKKYGFSPVPFARSAAYFHLKNGEAISWDLVGSVSNHVLRLIDDESATFTRIVNTNIYGLDELLLQLGKYPMIVPMLTAALFPPPGIGTALGLGVAAGIMIYNYFNKDYTKHNLELASNVFLGYLLPINIHIQCFKKNLIRDMDSKQCEILEHYKSYFEGEQSRIMEQIKDSKSNKMNLDSFSANHESFNQMLRELIITKGDVPSIWEQKEEALKAYISSGGIFEDSGWPTLMPNLSRSLEFIVERFKLLEVAEVIGCEKYESEHGYYIHTIPVLEKQKSYAVEGLKFNEYTGQQAITISSSRELLMRSVPVRKGYYTTTVESLQSQGILGKNDTTVSFTGGLSAIGNRVMNVSSIGIDKSYLIKEGESINFTVVKYTEAGLIAYDGKSYKLPVTIMSDERFTVREIPSSIDYDVIGIPKEEDEKLDGLLKLRPPNILYFFFKILFAQGENPLQIGRILAGIDPNADKLRSPVAPIICETYTDHNKVVLGPASGRGASCNDTGYLMSSNYLGYDLSDCKTTTKTSYCNVHHIISSYYRNSIFARKQPGVKMGWILDTDGLRNLQ